MFELVVLQPGINNIDSYVVTFYFLSYDVMGLNPRLFIGSVFKIFAEYISTETLYRCIFIIHICLNGLVALVLGRVLRRSSEGKLNSLAIFLLLFLSSPFSLSFLFNNGNFGYLDLYFVIITVVMVVFIRNKYLKWLIPALCVIAEAINSGWFLLYMPAVAIILMYESYNNKYIKSSAALCIASFLTALISLIVFQFLPHRINFATPEDVVRFVQHRTDYPLDSDIILTNFFLNVRTYFYDSIQAVLSFALPYSICVLIMTSPLIVVFIALWLQAYKKAKDKFSKLIVLLCMASPIVAISLFFNLDWDRWISAIFLVQFLLVFYFLDSDFPCVVEAAENIKLYFKKHMFLFVFIIGYMSLMVFSFGRVFLYSLIDRNYIFSLLDKYRSLVG